MTMPTTPAAHKRFVTDDDRIDRVYVVKLGRPYPDDEPWLTNIYWAAPARWFQRFFDYYAPKGQRCRSCRGCGGRTARPSSRSSTTPTTTPPRSSGPRICSPACSPRTPTPVR